MSYRAFALVECMKCENKTSVVYFLCLFVLLLINIHLFILGL